MSLSNRLPRAVCPACAAEVALRTGGQLREHKAAQEQTDLGEPSEFGKCPASGLTVAETNARIDAEIDALRSMVR